MAYDINAALERLENNLVEVESAKKQVEETIATSESLQQIIGRYTDTLNAMGKGVSSFIEEIRNYQDINTSELSSVVDALKTSCECVINKFNADVNTAIKNFDEKITETIIKFGSENEKLQIQINKLNSLKDVLNDATKELNEIGKKVDTLAIELKNCQGEQDVMLASIKSEIDALPSSVKSHAEAIVEEVKNQASDLKTKSEEIIGDVSKAIEKLDNQIFVITETKGLCNGIKTDLKNLKGSIDSQFKSMNKAIIINRLIAIIGILTLIVLHFI